MEMRQLRHLMAVVEHGSFSRAAQAVHLTQPALTRSIQALEAQVGAAVLERQRGDIAPTDIGRLLLTHARALDSASRDLERDIALAKGLELGELCIGVGPFGGSALVGPVLARLNRLHPRLHLRTVLAPWQELPQRLREREVDLIVVELSQVVQMEGLAHRALSTHAVRVVCRAGHPLLQDAAPTLEAVFNYPTAGPTPTPAMVALLLQLLPALAREPLRRHHLPRIQCDLSSVLKEVLRESDAIALMPGFMVAQEAARGELALLDLPLPGLQACFGAAWVQGRTLSPAALRFLELLQAHDQGLVAHSGPPR